MLLDRRVPVIGHWSVVHNSHGRYDVGFRKELLEKWGGLVTVARVLTAALAILAVTALAPGAAGRVPEPTAGCRPGVLHRVGTARRAWVVVAGGRVAARSVPGGRVVARFRSLNVNDYPTLFAVRGRVLDAACRVAWYLVQLPLRPNGATGYVPARRVWLASVATRIEVDLSARELRFFSGGRLRLRTPAAVGAPETPTPIGRFYVNQRLIPERPNGPFGPGALGVSAFSPALTDWVQGGPIAIHGTDDPSSIGRPVSNGCVRVPNATLRRLFRATPAGTPVVIHP
jgi:L,D-transpeptidase-like protein